MIIKSIYIFSDPLLQTDDVMAKPEQGANAIRYIWMHIPMLFAEMTEMNIHFQIIYSHSWLTWMCFFYALSQLYVYSFPDLLMVWLER